MGPVRVTPFEVKHASGAPPYALRFEADGKVLSFTGDTEWVESLVPAGQGADLYIMECYQFEGEPRFHTSWKTIEANLDRVGAKRVMLTHMADAMLARRGEVNDPRVVLAEDGLSARRMTRAAAELARLVREVRGVPNLPGHARRGSASPRTAPRPAAERDGALCASAARRPACACMPRASPSPIPRATG